MNANLLRLIADRTDRGWSPPSNIRMGRTGGTVLSFENVKDISFWIETFAASENGTDDYLTERGQYVITRYVGTWLKQIVYVVQCEKAKVVA